MSDTPYVNEQSQVDFNKGLSENAVKIVKERYLLPNEKGWSSVCQRVARCVASGLTLHYQIPIEKIQEFEVSLYTALKQRDFIFNSPTLFNIGRGVPEDLLYRPYITKEEYKEVFQSMNDKNMLSACFVVPVENSIEGIYTALKNASIISKHGGGVGYNFSHLSHKGRPLDSGIGTASGPLSFMQVFDASAKAVVQGGRRRSAQMGILSVDHPDIIEFISAKSQGNDDLSFFNISVMITDEFMQAVKEGTGFALRDPVTHQPVNMIDARGLWENIVHYAWQSGDPGLVFFGSLNRDRFIEGEYIEATNPCITGDTLVAVADGRGSVPIRQLAEEGKDVPVYTIDDKGKLVIRMMRNPRCTGKNKPIYRVTLDSGNYLDVTADHKFYLKDGTKKEAKDLQYGDRLDAMSKVTEENLEDVTKREYTRIHDESVEELIEAAEMVNCKVVSVEFIGYQDVYNGTVDDYHNFFIGGFECKTSRVQRPKVKYVRVANCGEIPTYSNLSCNLGHINLAHIVKNGRIDLDKLCYLVKLGVRALDLIIDVNHYPLPEIAERTKAYRPIGLGVMGFAHLLFLLGVKYGSPLSIDTASQLSRYIAFTSIKESIELARCFGAYPAYQEGDRSILQNNYILDKYMQESIENKVAVEKYGLRNASWNSIAPTGTVSLICDTSSGIEPVFALEHERVYIDSNGEKKTLIVQDPIYEKSQDKNADYFVDAHSISPEEHVHIQAAWQEYISSGVSKTINLPHNATEEDVRKVYDLAYELGCKGVTVYRDGCKGEQVLYRKENKETTSGPQHQPEQTSKGTAGGGVSGRNSTGKVTGLHPIERPKTTYGVTSEFSVACGTLYVTLNFDDEGNPIETFLTTGKGGVCRANVEAVSRTVSLALRSGIAKEEIVKQLKGIRCPYCLSKNKKYLSCADALAKFIERCQSPFTGKIAEEDKKINGMLERRLVSDDNEVVTCPECGAPIQRAEGCITCLECGYSKCS